MQDYLDSLKAILKCSLCTMHYVAREDTVNHHLVDMGYQISEEEIRDHNIGVTRFD